ncbi:hypothetical protein AGABI2DRAFT_179182 [Agaricus bisporus var. bisporus H97]|uniref:hypothetical protein n=1 Tax=Agaricus bisporus var. bisporus (strain H97 / ATCC MYA-4626 / FGSC 10389) TaxID=936046 RepID=UPI00029F7B8D|nr:hypothetical protein AGABI2DRAFT_179182 [Agaricus bisporus var. bisporus H97]EKV45623.1 hypothetical protein AGABI2DRAFT_179182 [Agaricus bisporus var. bisporus H97]
MDRLESLGNSLSQITLYDIKSMYNQAKNVVLNVSETEAKVREATNDDPWGASSTLMQDIAQGTFNFQQFNEIMPCIYGRFMEKEARQWRQIYKALQLLEYLIKHGSERVVDDARSHISTLKMLRNFHYIDEKGKDEGINVRNRAKELVELLADVEKIRGERRKAKANRTKYIGVGNDGGYGGGGFSSFDSGSRYGGFGSDSLGGRGSGGGGGGGVGGRGSPSNWSNDYYGSSSRGGGGFSDSSSGRRGYDEYNAGDDEISTGGGRASSSVQRSGSLAGGSGRPAMRKASTPTSATSPTSPTSGKAPAAPVANLLDFDDDDNVTTPAPAAAATGLGANKALPNLGLDDDDFADFQTAPTTTQAPAATMTTPAVASQTAKPNLMQLLNATPMTPTAQTQQQHRPTGSLATPSIQPMLSGTTMRNTTTTMGGGSPMVPAPMRANTTSPQANTKTGGGFDDLWNLSLASTGKAVVSSGGDAQGKSMKDLQKEKSTAGLWGAGGTGGGSRSGGDDLLL